MARKLVSSSTEELSRQVVQAINRRDVKYREVRIADRPRLRVMAENGEEIPRQELGAIRPEQLGGKLWG